MNRRHLPCLVVAALLVGGCASTDDSEDVELTLPTQAEADAQAASKISKQNADKEMAQLAKEIESDESP